MTFVYSKMLQFTSKLGNHKPDVVFSFQLVNEFMCKHRLCLQNEYSKENCRGPKASESFI